MTDDNSVKIKGIRLRAINIILIAIVFVLSIALLYISRQTSAMQQKALDDQIRMSSCMEYCETLHHVSDYLTDSARSFVVTGNPEFIQDYFEESNISRRREESVEYIRNNIDSEVVIGYAETALAESMNLMNTEYYAMRLKIESMGASLVFYPDEIKNVELTEWDKNLSHERQLAVATDMMFNDEYHDSKNIIVNNLALSASAITEETLHHQDSSTQKLAQLLHIQYLFFILLLLVIVSLLLVLYPLIVSPLEKAVLRIKQTQPLPLKGAYEVKYLAYTYNDIFEKVKKQRSELKYEVDHDALTGLFNRGAFNRACEELAGKPYTLVLADIDKFKGINDNYGHDVGDAVLKRLAHGLSDVFREEDLVFRIGGDEFAVILKTDEPLLTNAIPEKINYLNRILSSGGNRRSNTIPGFTISAGVSYALPSENSDIVFKHADNALYIVKHGGGKKCVFYNGEEASNG